MVAKLPAAPPCVLIVIPLKSLPHAYFPRTAALTAVVQAGGEAVFYVGRRGDDKIVIRAVATYLNFDALPAGCLLDTVQ